MSQQESGDVQPNVNPSLQPNHKTGGVQPNVNPSIQPNHENIGVQQNVNPPLQQNNESEGVQQNVNPLSQPNHNVSSASGSEEPQLSQAQSAGVQPNVNPSLQPNNDVPRTLKPNDNVPRTGSSEEPQLSQLQSAGELVNYYRPLYVAALRGDWKRAKIIIDQDRNALTAQITYDSQTALHVAAFCRQWGFVLKLLELLSTESIAMRDADDFTALHFAAQGGSLKTAKALVEKNANLLQMVNNRGVLPLVYSIWSESKELVWYLSLLTRVDSPVFPFYRPELPGILRRLIKSGCHDVALYFVRRYPNLAIDKDEDGNSLLYCLANDPSSFFSGSNLGIFERWIYKFVKVEIKSSPRSLATRVLQWFERLLWKGIAQLAAAPSLKMVRDTKLKHECAVELVNLVCKQLNSMSNQQIRDFLQNPKRILGSAVTGGIEEIVRALLLNFPDLMYFFPMPQQNILQAAIEYRQEKIVNIIKEINPTATRNFSEERMESENTGFHLAGKLAPAFKLFSVSGAALQMQRELQWFKEVENISFPYVRGWKNENNETAQDVFRKEHKELGEKGEKWMKNTANSCMLVSTLIATVLFAAAFTVPGGNENVKGVPIFLWTNEFTIFTISDALGLFSSLTSLLMFLAILTARYEMEDFLESLPKKLIIGLGTLFVAIAAMIIAFGATLTIVLSDRWHWVSVPITLLASFPVAIFVMLQLPLFVQMVRSTYGASIFRPWPSRV